MFKPPKNQDLLVRLRGERLIAMARMRTLDADATKSKRDLSRREMAEFDRDAGGVDWGALDSGPAATEPAAAECEQCGQREPEHAPGCSLELPF